MISGASSTCVSHDFSVVSGGDVRCSRCGMYGQALVDQSTDETSGLKERLAGWDTHGFPDDETYPQAEVEEGYFGTEEFLDIAKEIMEWRVQPEVPQQDANASPVRRGRPTS